MTQKNGILKKKIEDIDKKISNTSALVKKVITRQKIADFNAKIIMQKLLKLKIRYQTIINIVLLLSFINFLVKYLIQNQNKQL